MVVTNEKLEANRANARLSTGPQTEEGKRASSQNALTFGAYAADPVISGEDPAAYQSFRQSQLADLDPRTAPERCLADRAASLMWRLQRLQQAQHALGLTPRSLAAAYEFDSDNPFDRLTKAEQRLTGMLNTTLRNLHQLQSRRAETQPEPDDKLQNEPTPAPTPSSSASPAPPRCDPSPKEMQNEPNPTSPAPSTVPSACSVFSPPPRKLQNEPKPRTARLLFQAATRAAGALLPRPPAD